MTAGWSRRRLLGALGLGAAGGAVAAVAGAGPAAAAVLGVAGHSVLGRPLYLWRLGPTTATRRLLVLGQMHGDEEGGFWAARVLRTLAAPPGTAVYVMPTMNPDGLARGTRTNARGVDLNRNFPSADWRLRGAGTATYSGPSPGSEPETRAVLAVLNRLTPRTVVVLHQPWRCVDYSGGDRAVSDWLAGRLGLPARALGASGGNLTTWFNHRYPARTAVTVELMRPTTAAYRSRVAHTMVALAAWR